MRNVQALTYTQNDDANRLLATDPFALLLGLLLYQQIPTEKAFVGPYDVQQRLGHLDPHKIAAMAPEDLIEVYQQKPAIHRFPANMAKRSHALAVYVSEELGGDASNAWSQATSGKELLTELVKVPGFGEYKARVLIGVLGTRLGVQPDGWEDLAPDWPSIVDVATYDDVTVLKERKAAWKAQQKK